MNWKVGDIINDTYEVKEVKEGGMGYVYIVFHRVWGLVLALKIPKRDFLTDYETVREFWQEAETWVRLGPHANIINAIAIVETPGAPGILMEYVDGWNLRELYNESSFKVAQTIDFAIQICNGIDYANRKLNIIHQDIKPENCMVTRDGCAKLSDFGLAKALGKHFLRDSGRNSWKVYRNILFTKGGAGTLAYMSPEQLPTSSSKKVDLRSDIYSFGLMLYEMAAGDYPYKTRRVNGEKDIVLQIMEKHLTELPVLPSKINPLIPDDLDRIIMRCIEKKPKDRFPNFKELKYALIKVYERVANCKYKIREKELYHSLDQQATFLLMRGNSFYALRKYDEAINYYDRALQISPNFCGVLNNKGICLFDLGRYEEAIKSYKKSLSINPGDKLVWKNMFNPLRRLEQYDEAIDCCDNALNLDPEYNEALVNKAMLLSELGRHEEALLLCNNALLKKPNDELLWLNKGGILSELNHHREATECFTKALEINPYYLEALLAKGLSLVLLKQFKKAVRYFDKALVIDPKFEPAKEAKKMALADFELEGD